MVVHTHTRASMLAHIVQGVPKSKSHLVVDDETSTTWDKIAAGLLELEAKHPGAAIDIPRDV